jgi:uncharacterized integral membrane protein
MVLLNPPLLIGLAVLIIPVILHWLLRAKPKPLPFPALRLILNRRKQNVRRMRLRHIWLLLLRMLALGLLVLVVARPSVPAVDYGLTAADWGRVLAVVATLAAVYAGLLFVWKRRRTAPQRLQERRSWLRSALTIIGLLLFLGVVAWPYQRRVAASITQPTISAAQNLPVAAILLFDTSLSMQYGFESHTRLDMAQQIAIKHLRNLPSQSRVAVTETSGDDPIRFQADLSGARSRIESLKLQPTYRPLEERLVAALDLHREDAERHAEKSGSQGQGGTAPETVLREVYVFTDLALSAWRREQLTKLHESLEKLPSVNVYLIDVGITDPRNAGVIDLNLSSELVPLGNELTLRATVSSVGPPAPRTLELYLLNERGQPVKKGQTALPEIESGSTGQAQFSLRELAGPVAQGEVRLIAADPLAFDDVRSFSIRVSAPQEILVVAQTQTDAQYLLNALAQEERVRLGKSRYRRRYLPPAKLASEPLKRYSAVFLVDVADPGTAGWKVLSEYVQAGGGVGISLGPQVQRAAYVSKEALDLLPAELIAKSRFNPPEFLDLTDLAHPLFQKFANLNVGDLTSIPINWYWRVTATAGAKIICPYSGLKKPAAWIETTRGKGRVVLFTSALNRRGWNDIPADWPIVVLAEQTAEYLAQGNQGKLNYVAGETVSISLPADSPLGGYLLRKPEKQQLPGDIPPASRTLSLSPRDVDQLGSYRVLGAERDSPLDTGFSVNSNPAESRLDRIPTEELDRILGKDRYSISRDIEGLERKVKQGRVGREAFPLIALLLLAIFVGEHIAANFFYDAPKPEEQKLAGGA